MIVVGDRALLENGQSLVEPSKVEALLAAGLKPSQVLVTELTDEIAKFNRFSAEKIKAFSSAPSAPPLEWAIPDEYKYLDIELYLLGIAKDRIKETDPLRERREVRLAEELILFEQHGMLPLLRTLIFVVDRMKAEKVMWGVGRGSSCSSYILYLIGLHQVDPVKYDISVRDFIRD